MVKDVRELRGERGPHPFCELEILCDCSVHVPSIQTPEISYTAAACIKTQHAATEVCPHRGWVRKDVDTRAAILRSISGADVGRVARQECQ